MPERTGWLFDYYPRESNMVFWFIIGQGGPRLRLVQPYFPSCYVKIDEERQLDLFKTSLARTRSFRFQGPASKGDFWTGQQQALYEVQTIDLEHASSELLALYRKHPDLSYYDCDIPYAQFYAYRHNLFPTAYCRFSHTGENLLECEALETTRDTDYPPMPMRVATLHGEGYLGSHSAFLRFLALEMEGRTIEWNTDQLEDTLESLNAYLDDWDPDLIWTTGGDSLLMPCLFQISNKTGIPLHLDREPGIQRNVIARGRSYVSYGRIVYRDPDYPLWGRWHIDHRNCFLDHESDLDGLIEASRVSRLPVQRMARRSIGTGISSVQMAHVSRLGFPIPWKKVQPEAWKSALQLIRSDRGGLTCQPQPGVYENVIELDFVSMYPSIMVQFNVSPETINCACCPDSGVSVPELGYRICEKRVGMISECLRPLLEKRIEYKQRMRAATDPAERRHYKDRQTALKWLLVCCFGYLGYKNARFGRIEAHESICAYSREMLLQTRHLCEEWGYRVIHSLVDCVWLETNNHDDGEVERLCRAIEKETKLPITVEGRYSWLVFLSSTRHDDLPVPARYFGRFEDGSLKYRGIELRRSDQPPFVQKVQGELLALLARADSLAACREMGPELRAVAAEAERQIVEREVPLADVLLKRQLSRSAGEYRSNAMTATAARHAARLGKNLVGGQDVDFVVTNSKAGNPNERICLVDLLDPETLYDAGFYLEQLHRAVNSLLDPLLGKDPGKKRREVVQERMF
jgi:DNA polymerase-2